MTLSASNGQSAIFITYVIRDSNSSKWKIDTLDNPPYQTLETFCTAVDNKDYQTAYNQFAPGLQSAFTEQQFAAGFAGITTCKHSFPNQTGSTATATIIFGYSTGQTVTYTAQLIQESNGDWKIDNLVKQS
jgi:hypothetical protein